MNERYSRQKLFAPIGEVGQHKLNTKHVLIIGAGALGTGNAEALVRAGVGKLTIVDRDYVEWSNLQRQQLYRESDAELRIPKAIAAQRRLGEINSTVVVNAHVMDLTTFEVEDMTLGVDVIVDATDNFDTRLLINDISQKTRIPWIYGACVGSYGITYTIIPGETPCLNCLLETVPLAGATCDTVGIISPAVQMVVAYQTAEALKLLVGDRASLRSRLTSFDLWNNQHSSINVHSMKREGCLSCGDKPTYPYLSELKHTRTVVLCGRDTVQIRPPAPIKRNLEELTAVFSHQGYRVEHNPYLVSLYTGNYRLAIFQDGRVLVHGTNDIVMAKNLYHQYLG
ncbi:thiazole biosynthesis adenylyltransferase ThiF [Paenibacillus crassostreae]|uniref:Thiamine biosynthesis protein MoeB n=1 Tax=Paenibacillus crassostreae TaxID=1763538 RepID=A0A167FS01_9BACL|nr:thiazole biosynthesis adenylyltransferase ThiF [Paenibacillus crassostreae]AOZ94119.1 thiamine biosynthesis protein MoeB [Paenibacillus crassostreae]OAB76845.1 thiamine biosynthesis protein MoeB [Paenibacillus crassostreae]